MIIILITAYDINPYKGSESATGWNFILQASKDNKVIAITRKNNQESIDKYIEEFNIDISNIEFKFFDLPYWMRFWKKGARGSSLYFYLWQIFIPKFIESINVTYDIIHNLNFHTDAFPTFLWKLNKPMVWGPINHHEKINFNYILNKKEYIKDRIKWIIKLINWNFDPFISKSKNKSDYILCGNTSVKKRLNLENKNTVIFNQVASKFIEFDISSKNFEKFTVISAGRFVQLKGFDITLLSFEKFYNMLNNEEKENLELLIIGTGPMKGYLKRLSKNFNSINNIKFIDWVTKDELDRYYQKSNIFFFPSHEGAGMVVAEALSHGLPIICFDNYGPGELTNDKCAFKTPYSTYERSINDFAEKLKVIYDDIELQKSMSVEARKLFEEKYTWEAKGLFLKQIYSDLSKKYNLGDSDE